MKVFVLFFIFTAAVHAQDTGAYMVPRRVFVGDPAVLILPLPRSTHDTADIILTAGAYGFPQDPNIDFHKITLEHRAGGGRLMIEFTAFTPGRLELPVIEIGDEQFSGLSVTVNSLLENRSSLVLSGPASSLAMPGTALMLYGAMAGLVIFILFAIWFALKGRNILKKWKEIWKHWRLFASIKTTERRLFRSVIKGADKRLVLDKLSDEFRFFLSYLTGCNCRAMTAREFQNLPLEIIDSSSLRKFFGSCDELRFSGSNIDSKEIFRLLADMRGFIGTLEKAKKRLAA